MTSRSRARSGQKARRQQAPAWFRGRRVWIFVLAAVAVISGIGAAVVLKSGGSDGGPVTTASGGEELSQIRTPDFHSLAISPVDPNLILYGHHGGVLRSIDGGKTWAQTNLTGSTDDAMGMGISQADPNIVFAAGHNTFFRSSDGGKSWSSIHPKLPGTDVHGMALAPDKPGVLYANVVAIGLFRSDDAGTTWAKVNSQPYPNDVIQVGAGPGGRVYLASVGSGVLRSDDGGVTFRPTGKLSGSLLSVGASATDRETVYAGTDSRLFVSHDGGASWTQRDLPGGGEMMVTGVNPHDANDVIVVAVRADRAGHVFRSHDGGATWTKS